MARLMPDTSSLHAAPLGVAGFIRRLAIACMLLGLFAGAPGFGQQAAPPAPAPISKDPEYTVPANPVPVQPPATANPAAEPAKPPADTAGGELREYEAKPVLRLKGQSTWDDGFAALKKAISQLDDEARRLNLPRTGHAMAYFVDSNDLGFTYEAMLPLGARPPDGTSFGANFDATLSPAGRAVIFSHEGAYDEIDTAYEALTAWLDDKNLVSTGKFLEEYEFIPEKSDETTMRLKIVVFLK